MISWYTAITGFSGVIVGALLSALLTRQTQKRNIKRQRLEELMTLCNKAYSSIPPGKITDETFIEDPHIDVHRIRTVCQLYVRNCLVLSAQIENSYSEYRDAVMKMKQKQEEASQGIQLSSLIGMFDGGHFAVAVNELRERVFEEFVFEFGTYSQSSYKVLLGKLMSRVRKLRMWAVKSEEGSVDNEL